MTGSEISFQIVRSSLFLPLVQLYADSRIIRSINFSNVENLHKVGRTKETTTSVQLEIKIQNQNFIRPDLIKSVLILMEYALNGTMRTTISKIIVLYDTCTVEDERKLESKGQKK